VLDAIEATDGWVTNRVTADETLRIKGYLVVRRKGLDTRWADRGNVTAVCRAVAVEMVA
jgi:hypothetical protein